MTELLRVQGVTKHFDGVTALQKVDFAVAPGEVHALIGENGAGKSTLAKIMAGVIKPDAGELLMDGKRVTLRNPRDAQKLGIGIIFQELDLFPHLTIAENIAIGNRRVEQGLLVDFTALERFCRPFLDQVGLELAATTAVADLSIGQTQLVAIARALSMEARLLLMDEPTSSLADDAAERLFRLIQSLTRQNVAVVYVSHKMQEIFRIADRITVLRDGLHVGTREASGTSVDEVITLMVGRELKDKTRSRSCRTQHLLLRSTNLCTRKLSDVTFDLHAGEVLGVAGLVGSGRSELGAALFGLDPITGGQLEIRGRRFIPRSPQASMAAGVGLQPEDRKLDGLMMQMSVRENCTLAVLPALSRGGVLREGLETGRALEMLTRVRIKASSPDAVVSSLSGGNQQKVLIARWLLADPPVLFFDDPTRGIDVGAKRDIYEIIEDLARRGKGLIFVSSELPELLRCCDRIMVLHDGRNMGILEAERATPEHIMTLATRSAA